MKQPHDLTPEQQLWLAKQLPGEIRHELFRLTDRTPYEDQFYWGKSYQKVTPHEWDNIVRLVEKEIWNDAVQWSRYHGFIAQVKEPLSYKSDWKLSLGQRTTALMQLKGEKV